MTDDEKLSLIREGRKKLMQEIDDLKSQLKDINNEMRKNGYLENGKLIEPKTKHMDIGIKKFNKKPKDGLKYLFENCLLTNDPVDIARFLCETDLDKTAIGDYLGSVSDKHNLLVLKEFINCFDFNEIEFVEGLRIFLQKFILPGESQKIETILKYWSTRYYQCNKDTFNTEDEVFILAYAALMLNTTLNNPTAIKQNIKFGKEEVFVKDMLEYENTNFKEETIRNVYNAIKNFPLENILKDVDPDKWKDAKMQGHLNYQTSNLKSWQLRKFILLPEYLLILSEDEKNIRYRIPLEKTKCERSINGPKDFFLILIPDDQEFISVIKIKNRTIEEQKNMKIFKFACANMDEMRDWKNNIQMCIDKINESLDNNCEY